MKNIRLSFQYPLQMVLLIIIMAIGILPILSHKEIIELPYGADTLVRDHQDSVNTKQDSAKYVNLDEEAKEKGGFASKNLGFWSHCGLFLFSLFAALAFWSVAAYANRKYQENNPEDTEVEIRRTTTAYRWFTSAIFLWSLISLINIVEDLIPNSEDYKDAISTIRSLISSANSMFFMLALTYINIDFLKINNRYIEGLFKNIWKKISNNRAKYHYYIIGITTLSIAADMICIQIFSWKTGFLDVFLLSFVFSIMVGSGLYLVFKSRNLPELSTLALVTAIIIYISQILISYDSIYPESKSFFLYATQLLLTWLYFSFLLILLFSLVLSWLGWQKSDLLEEVNRTLDKQKKDLRDRNTQLENMNALNQAFISIVSGAMTRTYMEQLLDTTVEKLEAEEIFDYFFGIAVWNDDKTLVHFPYYKYKPEQPLRDYKTAPEETYVGYCLNQNIEIMEPNLDQPKLILRKARQQRNRTIAPDSMSLFYFPLRNEKGEAFGAITIQSKRPNPEFSEKQLSLLRSIATLFGKVVSPEDALIGPEISFIRNVVKGNDSMYHFGPEKKQTKRPNGYTLLDELMQWSKENTDSFFELREAGVFKEENPINRLMKGLSDEICSCGAVLMALTATVERSRGEDEPGNQIVMKIWDEIFVHWRQSTDEGVLEDFFRGKRWHQKNLEERFSVIYEMFKGLIYRSGAQDDKTSNLLNSHFDLQKQSISFEFGVDDPDRLKRNIEVNKIGFKENGTKGLKHDLSKHIVVLQSILLPGGHFTYEITNNSIITIFSL